MLILENIRLALSGLRANKMRALLTMLGIIIGITSVIAILTIGNSFSASLSDSFSAMGANNISVYVSRKWDSEDDGRSTKNKEATQDDYISTEMIEGFVEKYKDSIDRIEVSEDVGSTKVEEGKLYANISVTGVNLGSLDSQDLTILGGRNFSESEYKNSSMVCIVSDYYVNNMFGGDIEKALGSRAEVTISQKGYNFTIIGVYQYEESGFSFEKVSEEDTRTNVYVPIKTAKRITRNENYSSLTVVPTSDVSVDDMINRATNYFSKYYEHNQYFEVGAYSMSSMLEETQSLLSTLTIAISIIAGIALLVGGIGVMNILLVSITERTREIGTRKALGAPNSSIRIQFIVESIVICMVGGFIGMVLGIAGGFLGCKLMETDPVFTWSSVLIAVGFSLAIGVFFGYYPANKAAKLDPIEALRYE